MGRRPEGQRGEGLRLWVRWGCDNLPRTYPSRPTLQALGNV